MADSILINGKIHDWTDVTIQLGGEPYTGITSINWSSKKEKELQYAAGSAPHGIGYGHRSYTCDFTLTRKASEEFETIGNAVGKDALDYAPFLITVAYADKKADAAGLITQVWNVMKRIEIHDVDVTDISESLDEGTKKIVRKYTAVAGKIIAK
jgi:hypothetical protein